MFNIPKMVCLQMRFLFNPNKEISFILHNNIGLRVFSSPTKLQSFFFILKSIELKELLIV